MPSSTPGGRRGRGWPTAPPAGRLQRVPPPSGHRTPPRPPTGPRIEWTGTTINGRGAGPTPPPEDSEPPRRLAIAILALATLVALIGGAVVLWPSEADDPAVTAAPPTTASPPSTSAAPEQAEPPPSTTTSPPPDPELLAVVAEAQEFVSAVRGRAFQNDVQVRPIAPADWSAVISEQFELDPDALELEAIGLVALGLLTPDEAETYAQDVIASHEQISAFYNVETDIVVIRDGERDPAFRRTVLHEVTHAFDDQWFDLARGRDDFPVDSEAATTLELVLEGNAVRVETLWLAGLDDAERSAAGPAPVGRDHLGDFDDIVDFELRNRYLVGLTFAGHVSGLGGEELIDEQLEGPPSTSEQVWFPAVFDRGETRVPVPAPPAPSGAQILDEGPVGVSWWYGVLAFSTADLTTVEAEQAVDGWGGDWRVSWGEDGFICSRADLVGDTPADTEELRDAVRRWADATDGAVVASDVDGRIRIEYCVPDPAAGTSRI